MSNSNLASIKQLLNLLNCHINFKLTNSHRTLSSWSLSITNSLQFTKPSGLSQKPFNRWSKIPTQPNIKILNQFHFSSRCHNIIFVEKIGLIFVLFCFRMSMVVSVSCFLLLFFCLNRSAEFCYVFLIDKWIKWRRFLYVKLIHDICTCGSPFTKCFDTIKWRLAFTSAAQNRLRLSKEQAGGEEQEVEERLETAAKSLVLVRFTFCYWTGKEQGFWKSRWGKSLDEIWQESISLTWLSNP